MAEFGTLNWMDMPYNPHLSKNLSTMNMAEEKEGLALQVIAYDSINGEIKHIRLVGLNQKFTNKLFGEVMRLQREDFDVAGYANIISDVFAKYKTNDLVKMSDVRCRIN